MLPYGRQTIEDDDIAAVTDALQSDFLTTGPRVQQFEQSLQKATGAKHVIAVSNGTTALHLACIAAGLGEGDCAIVPTLTFLATSNAVRYCGADVIFADVDPDTGLMTADNFLQALDIAKAKNLKPKAVLPVHLTGQAADLKAIRQIADQNNMRVIGDASHALGTQYDGAPIGSCKHADFSTFSFHPVKTIAMGEGGAITTNDDKAADKMRILRHHGMVATPENGPWTHDMPDLGYNYRLTDIQCALGVSQLAKLKRFLKRRAEIVALYDKLFADCGPVLQGPKHMRNEFVGWHLYALRIDFETLGKTRTEVMNTLKENGVGTQVHYIPVHTQPYYEGLYGRQNLSGAAHYYERTLSIPLYPTLTDADVEHVAKTIKSILGL